MPRQHSSRDILPETAPGISPEVEAAHAEASLMQSRVALARLPRPGRQQHEAIDSCADLAEADSSGAHSFESQLAGWRQGGPLEEAPSRHRAAAAILAAKNTRTDALKLNGMQLSSTPECLAELDALRSLCIFNSGLRVCPALPPRLTALDLADNRLEALPPLPTSLVTLDVNSNSLRTLPVLPAGLKRLDAHKNQITHLSPLPASIKHLSASDNALTEVTDLPDSLQTLKLKRNRIERLPETLPAGLRRLKIAQNLLTRLPALPASLEILRAEGNRLEALPALPDALEDLAVSSNALRELPVLPRCLKHLNVMSNRLTHLPTLPHGLEGLSVEGNDLTSLPALPSGLRFIHCCRSVVDATIEKLTGQLQGLSALLARPPVLYALGQAGDHDHGNDDADDDDKHLAAMPDDVITQIASHFEAGSRDALMLAASTRAFAPMLQQRIRSDQQAAREAIHEQVRRLRRFLPD